MTRLLPFLRRLGFARGSVPGSRRFFVPASLVLALFVRFYTTAVRVVEVNDDRAQEQPDAGITSTTAAVLLQDETHPREAAPAASPSALHEVKAKKKKLKNPVAIFHGLSADAGAEDHEVAFLNQQLGDRWEFHSIEYARKQETILIPVAEQANRACALLQADPRFFSSSADDAPDERVMAIIGHSNGGMVGRHVLQNCALPLRIKFFVSVGGPQRGITKIPPSDQIPVFFRNLLDWVVRKAYLYPWVQRLIGPAGYVYNPRDMRSFGNANTFLGKLNNECAEYNADTAAGKLQKQNLLRNLLGEGDRAVEQDDKKILNRTSSRRHRTKTDDEVEEGLRGVVKEAANYNPKVLLDELQDVEQTTFSTNGAMLVHWDEQNVLSPGAGKNAATSNFTISDPGVNPPDWKTRGRPEQPKEEVVEDRTEDQLFSVDKFRLLQSKNTPGTTGTMASARPGAPVTRQKVEPEDVGAMLLIKFAQDEIVVPRETEFFAQENSEGAVVPLEDSGPFYSDDLIGLRTLAERKRLFFFTSPEHHDRLTDQDRLQSIVPLFRHGTLAREATGPDTLEGDPERIVI
ncbi:unnamed protein product [Amoebophrya sp. A120]|nr:unnamed protein product [Amoebophrya sp. A120]|eukprot:GSA120T00001047001.1